MGTRLTLDQVRDLAFKALAGSNTSEANARIMAEAIADGEADGIRNVALAYLPTYCEHARVGKVDGHAVPVVEQTSPGALRVDARDGFCHPAFAAAEADFGRLAASQGIAALAITNSSSAGIVGWFFGRLARRGFVSLGWANSSSLVAPHGGTTPFFGTNPLGFGAPRAQRAPLIVDMSTSATAYVNILNAAARGETIPDHWALDAEGNRTTDPSTALEGTVAPLGGYKGTGLALMVDVLAGAVTGSNFSFEASSFGDNEGGPVGVGQYFIAISPERFGAGDFEGRLEVLLAAMTVDGDVRIPGQRRNDARSRAENDGVEVDTALLEVLQRYVGSG